MRRSTIWPWLWLVIGLVYFFAPLAATLQFSLQARRGTLGFTAYANVLADRRFYESFNFSVWTALATIMISALLLVPAIYWIHLRMPRLRAPVEFLTLLPFVVPAVVLVFALARTYNRTVLTDSREGLWFLLVGAYVVLSFPYMYRAIDTGLRSVNVRTLTEAAQSLGAGWGTILVRIIFPNIAVALLGGAFVTFAIVMGEYTIASLLAQPAFGPYMTGISSSKVFEPSALAVMSFALTWGTTAVFLWLSRGGEKKA